MFSGGHKAKIDIGSPGKEDEQQQNTQKDSNWTSQSAAAQAKGQSMPQLQRQGTPMPESYLEGKDASAAYDAPLKTGVWISGSQNDEEEVKQQALAAQDNLFDDLNNVVKARSRSMLGDRDTIQREMDKYSRDGAMEGAPLESLLIDPSEIQRSKSMINKRRSVDNIKFDRKKDAMTYKQDPSKVIQREYIDGTPLLMDLNEILNLDVISIAMEELNAQRRKQKRQKVLPADDDNDPNIYVEQQITFDDPALPNILREEKQNQIVEDEKPDSCFYVDTEKQVVRWLRNNVEPGVQEESVSGTADGDEEDDEEDGGYMSDDAANKRALQYMMTGEYPDAEIDKLLETFGIQVSQIGAIPIKDFFQGEMIENDMRLGSDLREQIDDIGFVFKNWSTNKLTDKRRKQFLSTLNEQVEYIGVGLAVEHLLPGLLDIMLDRSLDQEKYQDLMALMFTQLGKLITTLSDSKITAGYEGVRDHLTPIYNEFFLSGLLDDDAARQLHDQSITQMAMITKVLIQEDRKDKILPIVLELLKDDEDKRLIGLELLDVLAADLGPDICKNYLMYEIVSLQDDPRYKVRKETVKRITNIAKVVENEMFLGVLLPVFKKLCTDQIWGVRRQAVEVLPEMCKLAPDDIKNGALLEIFKKFTKDQQKWVKMAAAQFLGPFIVCYKDLEPSPVLVEFCQQMVEENLNARATGNLGAQTSEDVLLHCAYNFPAILYTLGKDQWPQLKEIHTKLVYHTAEKVRRTLAYSLFEIAKILGPELTESDLLPVLFEFFNDIKNVKEGVMVSLPKFFAVLSTEARERHVARFAQAYSNVNIDDWRQREQRAIYIGQFAGLLTPSILEEHYLEIYFELCLDGIAAVRSAAAMSCYPLVKQMQQDESRLHAFLSRVNGFRTSDQYKMRQTFILMCESVFKGETAGNVDTVAESIFIDHFLDSFTEMVRDKIVNVRLQLAETIAFLYQRHEKMERVSEQSTPDPILDQSPDKMKMGKMLQGPVHKVYTSSRLCMHPKLINMVSRLRVDSNRDISNYLRHINLPQVKDELTIDSLLEMHKSDKKLSEHEKRELERNEKILKIVEQDNSGGKSETTNTLLQQLSNDKRQKEMHVDEADREQVITNFVEQMLEQVYESAIVSELKQANKNRGMSQDELEANAEIQAELLLAKVYQDALAHNESLKSGQASHFKKDMVEMDGEKLRLERLKGSCQYHETDLYELAEKYLSNIYAEVYEQMLEMRV